MEEEDKVRQISPDAIKTIDTNQVAYFTLTDGSVVIVKPPENENQDIVEQKEIVEIETTEANPEMDQKLESKNNEEQNAEIQLVKVEYKDEEQPEANKVVSGNFEKLGNSENLQKQDLDEEGKVLSYGGVVEERNNYKFYVSGVGYVDPNDPGYTQESQEVQQVQEPQEICYLCGNACTGESCDMCQSQEKVENVNQGQNLRVKNFNMSATTRIGNVQGYVRQNGQLYKVIEAVPVKLNEYDGIEYAQNNNTRKEEKTQLKNVNENYYEERRKQYKNVVPPKEQYVYTQQPRRDLEEYVENVEEQQYNNTYENKENNYENNYQANYENNYEANYENNYGNNYENNENYYQKNYEVNYQNKENNENNYQGNENNYENKYEVNYVNNENNYQGNEINYGNNYEVNYQNNENNENNYQGNENNYENKYKANYVNNYEKTIESKDENKYEDAYNNTYENKSENIYNNTYENEQKPKKLVCICGIGNTNVGNDNTQNRNVQRRCYTEYKVEEQKPKCICSLGTVVKDDGEVREVRKTEVLKSVKRPVRQYKQTEVVSSVKTTTQRKVNHNYYESKGYSAKARKKAERAKSGRK